MKKNSNPRSGYALLMVFAMAAIVAVTLYMQVPRAAFEAQRDKEELLMDRGHEYIRAITLFVHKFNRFPASFDELENTNRMRFLRRRYVDPMTGKADWRLLHAGPGGTITDSIMSQKKDAASQQTFITELKMFGADTGGGSEGVNLASRKRASDQPGAGTGNGAADNTPPLSNSSNPPQPGQSGYNGPVMVLPDGRIVAATSTGVPAPTGNTGAPGPGQPGFGVPGAPGASGGQLPSGVAIQQNALNGAPNVPGLPGQQQPPANAAGLINQILTTPRPGGINGLPGAPGAAGPGGFGAPTSTASTPLTAAPAFGTTAVQAGPAAIGAGIAGVASKREQEGIKTYNERTKYNEWEFVYDVSKDPAKNPNANRAGAAGASGGPGNGNTANPASNNGGPGMIPPPPPPPPPPPTR